MNDTTDTTISHGRLIIDFDVWGAQKKLANQDVDKILQLVASLRGRSFLTNLHVTREGEWSV